MRRGCLGDSLPSVVYLFIHSFEYTLQSFFPFWSTSPFVLSVLYTRFYRFFADIDILIVTPYSYSLWLCYLYKAGEVGCVSFARRHCPVLSISRGHKSQVSTRFSQGSGSEDRRIVVGHNIELLRWTQRCCALWRFRPGVTWVAWATWICYSQGVIHQRAIYYISSLCPFSISTSEIPIATYLYRKRA